MKERKTIDWEGLRLRLERSQAAGPDAERVRAVFRQRAERLARRNTDMKVGATELPVLVFQVGTNRYGIELSQLAEVIPHPLLAPVPGGPPELAGVIQVHGEIRPVWELSRLLGLPGLAVGDPECVLLIRQGPATAGLRVSLVEDIRMFRQEEPPPEPSRHVKWITSDLIAILNPEELFREEI